MELGFDFRLNAQWKIYFDDAWKKKLQEAIEYREANGGKEPTGSVRGVGVWLVHQRTHYQSGTLAQNRIDLLEQAGFCLGKRNRASQFPSWDERLTEYVKYKRENSGKDPAEASLGRWVEKQRLQYREGVIDEDRLAKLQDAGLDLAVDEEKFRQNKLASEEWTLMRGELVRFYEGEIFCYSTANNSANA